MKTNKGITLVALIITIVTLLILATVSIEIVDNKIWHRADATAKEVNKQMEEQEMQEENLINTWEQQPGKLAKSATFERNRNNSKPIVTVTPSNITTTTAKIVATGVDNDGDTLSYALTINNKTYGPSQSGTWSLTGLVAGTKYDYTVKVSDGYDTVLEKGSIQTLYK